MGVPVPAAAGFVAAPAVIGVPVPAAAGFVAAPAGVPAVVGFAGGAATVGAVDGAFAAGVAVADAPHAASIGVATAARAMPSAARREICLVATFTFESTSVRTGPSGRTNGASPRALHLPSHAVL
jgi:hypothetical protein